MAESDSNGQDRMRDDEWLLGTVPPARKGALRSQPSSINLSNVLITNLSIYSLRVAVKKITDGQDGEMHASASDTRYDAASFEVAPGEKRSDGRLVFVENRSNVPARIAIFRPGASPEDVSNALNAVAAVNPELGGLSNTATNALAGAISSDLADLPQGASPTVESIERGVERAAESNPEIRNLSHNTMRDIRLGLILSKPREDREPWIAAITWQSAEAVGNRLAWATWGLVAATAMLFLATIVLILVTALHK